LSTPNITALRSRWRWLLTGFHNKGKTPLDETAPNPWHHIGLMSFPEIRYLLHSNGFRITAIAANRVKLVSWLYAPLLPLAWLVTGLVVRRSEKNPALRRRDAEVRRQIYSTPVAYGETLIVKAVCTKPARRSEDRAREPTIALAYGAGDIAGAFGRQEHHGCRQLRGRADPVHRNLGQSFLHHLGASLGELLDPLGGDEPRTNTVHSDTVRRALVGQRFGKAEDAGARSRGEDQAGQRLQCRDGCETDDAAPFRLGHDWHGRAGEVDRGQQIELDCLLPRVGGLILEWRRGRPSCIAEQHIEPAELLRDVVDQPLSLGRDADIRGKWRVGAAAVDRDLRAFFREHGGDGAADAAGASADQSDPPLESEVHARSRRTAQTFSSAIFA